MEAVVQPKCLFKLLTMVLSVSVSSRRASLEQGTIESMDVLVSSLDTSLYVGIFIERQFTPVASVYILLLGICVYSVSSRKCLNLLSP